MSTAVHLYSPRDHKSQTHGYNNLTILRSFVDFVACLIAAKIGSSAAIQFITLDGSSRACERAFRDHHGKNFILAPTIDFEKDRSIPNGFEPLPRDPAYQQPRPGYITVLLDDYSCSNRAFRCAEARTRVDYVITIGHRGCEEAPEGHTKFFSMWDVFQRAGARK